MVDDCPFSSLWAIYNNEIFDLSDYLNTLDLEQDAAGEFQFLNEDISDLFKQQPGEDITKDLNNVLASLDTTTAQQNMDCLNNMFFQGKVDFRKSARCQVQNIMLLTFSILLMTSMGLKCKSPFWLRALVLRVLVSPCRIAVIAQTQSGNAR